MTNSWEIMKVFTPDNDLPQMTVAFTINGERYEQTLYQYWEGSDIYGNAAAGGIRVDTQENTSEDLNSYMSNYAAGITAAQTSEQTNPLVGLTGGQ